MGSTPDPREERSAQGGAPAKKKNDFIVRLLAVLPLIPILLGFIYWKDHRGVFGVVLVATAIGLYEFYAMTIKDDAFERWVGVALGLCFAWCTYWYVLVKPQHMGYLFPTLAGVVMVAFTVVMLRVRDMASTAQRVATLIMGTLYVGFLFTHLSMAKRLPFGEHGQWVLLILTINWFADTGAYITGKLVGKHKLYPAVSPGKSVEGAIGGLAASVGAAVIAKVWYLKVLGWDDVVIIGLGASALGQVGDLCESMLKRACGVKDSGKLLPGHGGILDRVDAVLFGAPFVFWYAALKVFAR